MHTPCLLSAVLFIATYPALHQKGPSPKKDSSSRILLNSQGNKLSYGVIEAYLPSVRGRQNQGCGGQRAQRKASYPRSNAGVRSKCGDVIELGDRPFGNGAMLPHFQLVLPSPRASMWGVQPQACKDQLSIPSKPFQEPYQIS